MKLGIPISYSGRQIEIPLEKIKLAEKLGYDSIWSAEAYGSDALTPLAFIAAHTERIRLGTGVVQVAARTPASLGMSTATLDQLTGGGRVIVGLGVSGPQIVEGWYGVPWGSPAERLKDYVQILKKIYRREGPLTHDGKSISLPYQGDDGLGMGKPLKSIIHPNPDIPVWLGCGGEKSVEIMATYCDGWLPMGMVPENWDDHYREIVERGLSKSGRTLADLEIQGGCSVEITDNLEAAWARRKKDIGLLVGGYGSKTHNFHKDAMCRRGYQEEAEKVQTLFLAGKQEEACKSIPDSYIDEMGLYGPEERIRERFARYLNGPYTGLTVHPNNSPDGDESLTEFETLELLAELAKSE